MKRIGIVACAGRSSRTGLGEYTTKAALPLRGRSLLAHQIEFLQRSGADVVFVVCRPEHARLLASGFAPDRFCAFLLVEEGGGWVDRIERAMPWVGDDDEVAIVPCDNYPSAPAIEWLDGQDLDAIYTYTAADPKSPPTTGSVFGARRHFTSAHADADDYGPWCEMPGSECRNGLIFTGYIVARGHALREALPFVHPSARGEREIAGLLHTLQHLGPIMPVPYPGLYEDVADLQALARIEARLRGAQTEGEVDVGAGVLVRSGDRVLLIERQDGLGWVPPGGCVDHGERFDHAALRELREEAGLDLRPEDLRLLGVYPTTGKGGRPAVSIMFAVRLDAEPGLKLEAREVKSAKWVTASDLPQMIPFDLGLAVEDLFTGRQLDCRPLGI